MRIAHGVGAALAGALLGAAGIAGAQPAEGGAITDYPARPVRWVVPFTPGGGTDIIARLVGRKLGDSLGQPFVIDNRPGAGGAVGADTVAKAAPQSWSAPRW